MKHKPLENTDLPVILPAAKRLQEQAALERQVNAPVLRLQLWHGLFLIAAIMLWSTTVWAVQLTNGTTEPNRTVFDALWTWSPIILGGFVFNIILSALSMSIGTALGTVLGMMQVSLLAPVRKISWFLTQFFRNAPWLVLIFFCVFLLPFQFQIGDDVLPFPGWIKAVIALSLPVMANTSEIVRGAIQSIPSGQWESAYSLCFNRRQILLQIILPQCIKRMLPPWMNLYAILTMATVLASIVGVPEVLTLTQRALAAENNPALLVPFYGYILVLFFIYCYPIARLTQKLELRYAVKS